MPDENSFYGKYRGTVLDNIDPLQSGRLQVEVPDVAGTVPSTWALPCLPFAGTGAGFFAVPPVGSLVWVEFEQGDPDYPIWTGCFWGTAADVPPLALAGPWACSRSSSRPPARPCWRSATRQDRVAASCSSPRPGR